jgi:AcrR family transcriptional regulator
MDIEELCHKTGFNKQSIYRYIRSGLLPKPAQKGFSQPVFDEDHLRVLRKIQHLRETEGLPLSKIRVLVKEEKDREESALQSPSESKKEQIMDKAIALFSKNGYSTTKISDITDALGVAKGTFYLYFKSKKDLFIECISRLTMIIVPTEIWDDVRKERDFIERQRIKLTAFLKTFPSFSGILNLLRLSFQSDDLSMAKKARDTYKILAGPLMKDLRRAVADGASREVNVEIASVLLMGMAENLGYSVMMDPRCTVEEGTEILLDIIRKGLLLPKQEGVRGQDHEWAVTDSQGLTVRLKDIRFGQEGFLPGILGEGEIKVPIEYLVRIELQKVDGMRSAVVTGRDGDQVVLGVDETLAVSGNTNFGEYNVPLAKIDVMFMCPKADGSAEVGAR